jgi:SPOR domain
MSTTMTPATQPLGDEGELCPSCGLPMAADQRYCLQCGARRGASRVPVPLGDARAAGPPSEPPVRGRAGGAGSEWTPLTALGLVGLIALILVAGVLIGRGLDGSDEPAQVVQTGDGNAPASESASAGGGSFESDWPSGKDGYTIALGTLSKDGASAADVAAAKDDATAKGAPKVGALDSDEFGSLPGGEYVVYSGVYSTKAAAAKALKKLKADFPDARVVKVSADAPAAADSGGESQGNVSKKQLESLENLSGDDYVKQSKKLPDETATPGKLPPKDEKAPGGGTGAVEF